MKHLTMRIEMIRELMNNEKKFDQEYYDYLFNCSFKMLVKRYYSQKCYIE